LLLRSLKISTPKSAATVLVVDDHPFIVNYSALLLEQALPGVRVLKAANGAEALALTFSCEPDLVLLDITLRMVTGWI